MKKILGIVFLFTFSVQVKANLQALGMGIKTKANKEVIGFIGAQLPFIPDTTKKKAKDSGYDLDVLIAEAKKGGGGFQFPSDKDSAPKKLEYIAEKLVAPAVQAVKDSNDPGAANAVKKFKTAAEKA